jgi:hypothetical protein
LRPRLQHGLPRGGMGYLGLPLGLVSSLSAWRFDGVAPLVLAGLACPACLWLGLGLRSDGLCGEAADEIVWESPRRYDWFRLYDNVCLIFRLSNCTILLGLAGLLIAVWRLTHSGLSPA